MVRQRKKLLIIDGYNVLRSGSRYRDIVAANPDYTDDAFNTARETLINDVINYAGYGSQAIIVFDGAHNRYSEGQPQTVGGVKIIFSPAGQPADHVIEKLAHDARERMVEALVVTSDAGLLPRRDGSLRGRPTRRCLRRRAQEHHRFAHPGRDVAQARAAARPAELGAESPIMGASI